MSGSADEVPSIGDEGGLSARLRGVSIIGGALSRGIIKESALKWIVPGYGSGSS